MVSKFSKLLQNMQDYKMTIILCLFWMIGLLAGLHIYLNDSCSFSLSMLLQGKKNAAISFIFLLVPLILSLVSFIWNSPKFILPISFLKGCAYGFSLTLIGSLFGKGSWLAQMLFLFPATVSACFHIWLWLRHIEGSRTHLYRDCCIVFSALCAAWLIDTLFLSSIQIII